MTAPTTDRELSHPAARAAHAMLEANRLVSAALVEYSPAESGFTLAESLAPLIVSAPEDIASLYQDILAMEQLDTKRVLVIADLKTRLARAAEELEALYRLTNHAVGEATERHLLVTRARALLDLTTPLPPKLGGITPVAPSTNGAPRAAATSH